jgi:hypothetical protein
MFLILKALLVAQAVTTSVTSLAVQVGSKPAAKPAPDTIFYDFANPQVQEPHTDYYRDSAGPNDFPIYLGDYVSVLNPDGTEHTPGVIVGLPSSNTKPSSSSEERRRDPDLDDRMGMVTYTEMCYYLRYEGQSLSQYELTGCCFGPVFSQFGDT